MKYLTKQGKNTTPKHYFSQYQPKKSPHKGIEPGSFRLEDTEITHDLTMLGTISKKYRYIDISFNQSIPIKENKKQSSCSGKTKN